MTLESGMQLRAVDTNKIAKSSRGRRRNGGADSADMQYRVVSNRANHV